MRLLCGQNQAFHAVCQQRCPNSIPNCNLLFELAMDIFTFYSPLLCQNIFEYISVWQRVWVYLTRWTDMTYNYLQRHGWSAKGWRHTSRQTTLIYTIEQLKQRAPVLQRNHATTTTFCQNVLLWKCCSGILFDHSYTPHLFSKLSYCSITN